MDMDEKDKQTLQFLNIGFIMEEIEAKHEPTWRSSMEILYRYIPVQRRTN